MSSVGGSIAPRTFPVPNVSLERTPREARKRDGIALRAAQLETVRFCHFLNLSEIDRAEGIGLSFSGHSPADNFSESQSDTWSIDASRKDT